MRTVIVGVFAVFLAAAAGTGHRQVKGHIQSGAGIDQSDISVATRAGDKADVSWDTSPGDGHPPKNWTVSFDSADGSPCSNGQMVFNRKADVCTIDGTGPGKGHACGNEKTCYKYTVVADGKTNDPRVIIDSTQKPGRPTPTP